MRTSTERSSRWTTRPVLPPPGRSADADRIPSRFSCFPRAYVHAIRRRSLRWVRFADREKSGAGGRTLSFPSPSALGPFQWFFADRWVPSSSLSFFGALPLSFLFAGYGFMSHPIFVTLLIHRNLRPQGMARGSRLCLKKAFDIALAKPWIGRKAIVSGLRQLESSDIL